MTGTTARRHLWYDVGWPVLAGVVVAVGLAAALLTWNPGIVLACVVVTDLTFTPLAWVLATGSERSTRRAVLVVTPVVTLALVVAAGLILVLDLWGPLVWLVTVGTSPFVLGRQPWSRQVRDAVRTAETRRAFDEIVQHSLEPTPGEDPDPDA